MFPVLSRSLAPKSPRSRKSSDASPAMLHAVKYERYTPRMHACIEQVGTDDASWTMGVAFTSTTPHANRLSQSGMNVHTRDASAMSIRPRVEILFSLFSLMAVYDLLRDAISFVALAFFVTFGTSQSEEERQLVVAKMLSRQSGPHSSFLQSTYLRCTGRIGKRQGCSAQYRKHNGTVL